MAAEIQHAHLETGRMLYAIVRDAQARAYHGTNASFEAYVTAHLAQYARPMTEQGAASRFYVADFPPVSAGRYHVTLFDRLNPGPDEDDVWVAQFPIEWDGARVISLDGFAEHLLDREDSVETGFSLRQSLRLMLAALAGKLSGAGTTTIVVRSADDAKPRIVATVDAAGNRTALTLDAE